MSPHVVTDMFTPQVRPHQADKKSVVLTWARLEMQTFTWTCTICDLRDANMTPWRIQGLIFARSFLDSPVAPTLLSVEIL